jgi:hypothetical protein
LAQIGCHWHPSRIAWRRTLYLLYKNLVDGRRWCGGLPLRETLTPSHPSIVQRDVTQYNFAR